MRNLSWVRKYELFLTDVQKYKFKRCLFFTFTFMASSTIQNVSSCPDYINKFIQHNMEKLMEIYDAGYETNNKEGCLGFMCNEETNKMDVMFLNKENITSMLTADSWENLKLSIPEGKKLFFVKDEGAGAVFLLYI